MAKVVIIVPQQDFNDKEFSTTKSVLEESGIEIDITSITRQECVGMYGLKVTPNKIVGDIVTEDYDALIIIGGSGSLKLLEYPEVLNRVRSFTSKNKLTAAICLAPMVLAKAGVLKGVMSTVFPTDFAISTLKQGDAHYTNKHVVVDGNIITADGPDSALGFVKEILKKLKGQ